MGQGSGRTGLTTGPPSSSLDGHGLQGQPTEDPASSCFQDLGSCKAHGRAWHQLVSLLLLVPSTNKSSSINTNEIPSFLCLKESLPLILKTQTHLHAEFPPPTPAPTADHSHAVPNPGHDCSLSSKSVPASSSSERDHAVLPPSPIPVPNTTSQSCPIAGRGAQHCAPLSLAWGLDSCSLWGYRLSSPPLHLEGSSPGAQQVLRPHGVREETGSSRDFPGGPGAKGACLIPGQGTRSLMLQLRAHMLQLNRSCMPQLRSNAAK